MASTNSSGDLFGTCLFTNPRCDIFQEKFVPSSLLEDVSPAQSRIFLGDITQKHCICFENTFWEIRLKNIQATLRDKCPQHIPEERGIFWGTPPKNGHPTTPNRSLKLCLFFSGNIFQNHSQKLFNIFFTCFFHGFGRYLPKKNFRDLLGSGLLTICGRYFPKYSSGKCWGHLSPNASWKCFQACPPEGIFKTNAVFWVISPKICACLWARHLPKGC